MAPGNTSIDIGYWLDTAKRKSIHSEFRELSPAELQAAFQQALPLPPDLEPRLQAALGHLLDHPGSMVRPRIVHRLATAYGFNEQHALDLAIALECFHTASLVFDDLPCMDDASSRRGAPCVHVLFGDSGAVLAALALINRAYALIWKAIVAFPRAQQWKAVEYLEQRLGVEGLLNGQSLDLNYSALPHDRGTAERIASGKTVSLIRLTFVFPAMLAGASARELQLLERVATCWGLGYQIADDLKDILQTSIESGKTAARDLQLDRPNFAVAAGIPAATLRLARLIKMGDRTLDKLLEIRPELDFLKRLRSDLQLELNRVAEDTRELVHSSRP
jgi:geranylgeranyl pyrophosphate synthase